MRSLVWILIATSLNFAACGQGSHSLTGKSAGKPKNGELAGQEKAEGVFTAPENSTTDRLQIGQSTGRVMRIQKQSTRVDYQCVEDLLSEETLKRPESIKILRGSRMLFAQDTTVKENTLPGRKKVTDKVPPVVNAMCIKAYVPSPNGVVASIEVDETIQKLRLEPGTVEQFSMKLGTLAAPVVKSVLIGCVANDKIVEAAKALSEFHAEGADLLLVDGTAVQFLMANDDGGATQRLVVTCAAPEVKAPAQPAAPPAPPTPEAPGL